MKTFKTKANIVLALLLAFILISIVFATGIIDRPRRIKGIEDVGVSFENFKVPEDVKVVGIGEATHGNTEFQTVKLEVLKKLVESGKCHAIAFEMTPGEAAGYNYAIQQSSGDITELISKTDYPLYDTPQMVELIEWMRNYNLSHDPNESVRFYGIDMQGGYRDLEYLADVAKRDSAFYEAEDSEKLISLAADEDPDLTAEHDFFESLSKKLAAKSDAEHRTAAVIAGTVLQWADAPRYSEDPAGYGLYRDSCMAQNLMDYYNIELSRGYDQILVTAHNGHVAKGPDTAMGSCINELFEGSYYCIGTDFYNTVVNVHTAGTYDENYQRADHEYCSDSPMAYQAQFFKDGRYCLDLKSITDPGNKIYKLIHKPNFTGMTGEGYNPMWEIYKSYRARIVAVDHYDAMIYYYNTTPIRPIHY